VGRLRGARGRMAGSARQRREHPCASREGVHGASVAARRFAPRGSSGRVGRSSSARSTKPCATACSTSLLLTGEPGLGKTRSSTRLRERGTGARRHGPRGPCLRGRGRPAVRPWIDALRQLPSGRSSPGWAPTSAPFSPSSRAATRPPRSRDRLFGAVVELLAARGASAPPVVVALDRRAVARRRLAELLHFVARTSRHRCLLFASTARAGELHDNETVQRTCAACGRWASSRRSGSPRWGRGDARAPPGRGPDVDAEAAFAESGGNPLFALEVARSLPDREGPLPARSSSSSVTAWERLPSEAGDLLRWAAVLGCSFDVGRLSEADGSRVRTPLAGLELSSERHALLRAQGNGRPGAGAYEFTHEVVRRAVYSEPLASPAARLMPPGGRGSACGRRREGRPRPWPGRTRPPRRPSPARTRSPARGLRGGGPALPAPVREKRRRQLGDRAAGPPTTPPTSRSRSGHSSSSSSCRWSSRLAVPPTSDWRRRRSWEALAERALGPGERRARPPGLPPAGLSAWEEGELADAQRPHDAGPRFRQPRPATEKAQVVAMAEAGAVPGFLLERELPRRGGAWPSRRAHARGAWGSGRRRSPTPRACCGSTRGPAWRRRPSSFQQGAPRTPGGTGDPMGDFQALEHLVVLRQQQKAWPTRCASVPSSDGPRRESSGRAAKPPSPAPLVRPQPATPSARQGPAKALDAALEELRVADREAPARLHAHPGGPGGTLERGDPRRARRRPRPEGSEGGTVRGRLAGPPRRLLAGV